MDNANDEQYNPFAEQEATELEALAVDELEAQEEVLKEFYGEVPREHSQSLDSEPTRDLSTAREFVRRHFDTDNDDLAELFVRFDKYLAILDPDAVVVVMATAVATAATDDDPLWLMLVGSSSGSKSETIRTVAKLADRNVSDLTRAGLLGGHPTKEGIVVKTGLLAKLDDGCNALVTVSDLSSLLSRGGGKMSGQEQSGIFEALRDIFDGQYTRTMDRLEIQWQGRLTLLAGVTPAIDAMRAYTTQLGTRFCYFRLDHLSDKHRLTVARTVAKRKELQPHRAAAQVQAGVVVERARERVLKTSISDPTAEVVVLCANLAGYGRMSLPRNYRGEVEGVADWEEPGRLTGQLVVLARSLVAIGLGDEAVQRIVKHTAQSCMPADVSGVLRECDEWRSTAMIASRAGLHRSVTVQALEGWAATGVVCERRVTNDGMVPPSENGPDRRTREWSWSDVHRANIESALL